MKTYLEEVLDSEFNIPKTVAKQHLECRCSKCKQNKMLSLQKRNNINALDQESHAAAIGAAAITTIASIVPGVLQNENGVDLILDEMPGFLHPNEKINKNKNTDTYIWKGIGHELSTTTARVGAYFDIYFDINGESIGNVFIIPADLMDPYRADLLVRAKIIKDQNTYTVGRVKMRQVKIIFTFEYTFTFSPNEIWRLECFLRGDGQTWFNRQAYKTSS